jgi:RimJ/RimL family protein N-acetyltransferase
LLAYRHHVDDGDMLGDHIPLFGLRLRTPDLELRLPDLADLGRLADVAADGVHDPAVMPFTTPWTDWPDIGRTVVLHAMRELGRWQPEDWSLGLVAFSDGEPLGKQVMTGKEFAVTRDVHTGSWMGRRFHGRGLGTQMRAAVLALAFEGLGAASASSGAHLDNPASLRVSEKLGYLQDGVEVHAVRGKPMIARRLRLTRQAWEQHRTIPVEIIGLAPCLPMFGLPATDS